MTPRELAAALLALPEDQQDLPTYSAGWGGTETVTLVLFDDPSSARNVRSVELWGEFS